MFVSEFLSMFSKIFNVPYENFFIPQEIFIENFNKEWDDEHTHFRWLVDTRLQTKSSINLSNNNLKYKSCFFTYWHVWYQNQLE